MKSKPGRGKVPQAQDPNIYSRYATLSLMALFVVVSLVLCVVTYMRPDRLYFDRALLFPLFLLIPWVFRLLRLRHCWRLYCLVYLFSLFAYSYGCVWGAFSTGDMVIDKVCHFFSGTVFTVVGFCLYYLQVDKAPAGPAERPVLAASYALFFSAFIGVMWEVCEFVGFFLTGNDSQNNATTGVFDTMYDLISCLVASLLSVLAFLLWRKTRVKLATAAIIEEFYEKNAGLPGWKKPEK